MKEEFEKAKIHERDLHFWHIESFNAGAEWAYEWLMDKDKESKFGSLWANKYYDKVEAVVVTANKNSKEHYDWCEYTLPGHTHKALLIDIQPIKKESCADVLREVSKIYGSRIDDALLSRVKKALENEE